MNIGEKIRNARLAKGMTQEELGRILGVQKSAIAKYENGRVVNIKRSTLKKISNVLSIPPYELIYEEIVTEEAQITTTGKAGGLLSPIRACCWLGLKPSE